MRPAEAKTLIDVAPLHPAGANFMFTADAGLKQAGFVTLRVPHITKKRLDAAPICEFDLAQLPTGQAYLVRETVKTRIDQGVAALQARKLAVLRQDGVDYLLDGNHTASALILLGVTTITAKVIDARIK
jgi:hypothetical protein